MRGGRGEGRIKAKGPPLRSVSRSLYDRGAEAAAASINDRINPFRSPLTIAVLVKERESLLRGGQDFERESGAALLE